MKNRFLNFFRNSLALSIRAGKSWKQNIKEFFIMKKQPLIFPKASDQGKINVYIYILYTYISRFYIHIDVYLHFIHIFCFCIIPDHISSCVEQEESTNSSHVLYCTV